MNTHVNTIIWIWIHVKYKYVYGISIAIDVCFMQVYSIENRCGFHESICISLSLNRIMCQNCRDTQAKDAWDLLIKWNLFNLQCSHKICVNFIHSKAMAYRLKGLVEWKVRFSTFILIVWCINWWCLYIGWSAYNHKTSIC